MTFTLKIGKKITQGVGFNKHFIKKLKIKETIEGNYKYNLILNYLKLLDRVF